MHHLFQVITSEWPPVSSIPWSFSGCLWGVVLKQVATLPVPFKLTTHVFILSFGTTATCSDIGTFEGCTQVWKQVTDLQLLPKRWSTAECCDMQLIVHFSQDRCYEIANFYRLDGLNDSVLFVFSQVRVFLCLDLLLVSFSFSFSLLLWVLWRLVGSCGDFLALFFALPQRFSEVVVISTSAAISMGWSLIRTIDHVHVNGSRATFLTVNVGYIHAVRYSLPALFTLS